MLRLFCWSALASVLTFASVFAASFHEGKKMFFHQRYDRAVGIFEQLIAEKNDQDKHLGELYYYLSDVYIAKRKVAKALEVAKAGMKRVPADPWVMLALGQALLCSGQENEAKPLFENALHQSKKRSVEYLTAVLNAYAHSKYGNPEYVLAKIRDLDPKARKDVHFYSALGDVYKVRLQDASQTHTNYRLGLNNAPRNVQLLFKIGKFALSQGDEESFREKMQEVIREDEAYAPAYYELYAYYYTRDVNQAKQNFLLYKKYTDISPSVEFEEVSIFYAAHEYQNAIDMAKALIVHNSPNQDIRIYRLIGYAYNKINTPEAYRQAKIYMDSFFVRARAEDPDLIRPDNYEVMGDILSHLLDTTDQSTQYYALAFQTDTVLQKKISLAVRIADLAKKNKKYAQECEWRRIVYSLQTRHGRKRDLFAWGLAALRAGKYPEADSVFSQYATKYPDEYFGYYYQGRARLGIDTSMQTAMPLFTKTLTILSANDSLREKSLSTVKFCYEQQYSYEARQTKDYARALALLDTLIALDPNNADRQQEKTDLENYIQKQKEYEAKLKAYNEKMKQRKAAQTRKGDNKPNPLKK